MKTEVEDKGAIQIQSPGNNLKTNPSPYYYSDLLKKNLETSESNAGYIPDHDQDDIDSLFRKNDALISIESRQGKRYSITEGGVHIIRCGSPSSSTSEDSDCLECQKKNWYAKTKQLEMPQNRILGPTVCACVANQVRYL